MFLYFVRSHNKYNTNVKQHKKTFSKIKNVLKLVKLFLTTKQSKAVKELKLVSSGSFIPQFHIFTNMSNYETTTTVKTKIKIKTDIWYR